MTVQEQRFREEKVFACENCGEVDLNTQHMGLCTSCEEHYHEEMHQAYLNYKEGNCHE